jgi:hypothetical protein
MNDEFDLLSLSAPVGRGQENNPEDIEALDGSLRKIGAYAPPPEYAGNTQRYATEPMIGALERYQNQNGLKVDGVANPGGPTERAINNRLLGKPRGAGLLFDPPTSIDGAVGNGFKNRREDVAGIQRKLGALNYLAEDPFDRPHGFIDEPTINAITRFQRNNGLTSDGWLAPRGETERALEEAIADLARANEHDWFEFAQRAGRAQQSRLAKFREAGVWPPADANDPDGPSTDEVIPVRAPPGATLGPPSAPPLIGPGRGLIEINPRYLPSNLPDLRKSVPMPRDLQWSNPGELPNTPVIPKFRPGSPTRDAEAPSVNDIPRALGLPSLDDEVRRALPIPPRREAPDVYIPAPGSPLRIPILDIHHGGMWGDQRSIQTTKDATDAIEEACKKVFKDAQFERKTEKYYRAAEPEKGTTKGASFADEWMGMFKASKDLTIHFVTDGYTPKVDGTPIAAEERRFVKLEPNRIASGEEHIVTVRIPKVWTRGQSLDKEKLQAVTKEICEQIKKMLDEGEIGPDKPLRIRRMLKELVEPKKKPAPEPEEPAKPR